MYKLCMYMCKTEMYDLCLYKTKCMMKSRYYINTKAAADLLAALFIIVLFYISPTAKVICRGNLSLRALLTDWRRLDQTHESWYTRWVVQPLHQLMA